MTALCTPLADGVDPPQPTTAPPSSLTPFKITTEAAADREDKVIQGTESSAVSPAASLTATGQNTKAEQC